MFRDQMGLSWLKSASLLSQNSWFIVSLCLFFSQLHPMAGSPWWKMVACKLGYHMISCPYPWRGSVTLYQLNRIGGPVFIICQLLIQSVSKVNQSLVSKYHSHSSHLELGIGAAWWLQWQRGMKWCRGGTVQVMVIDSVWGSSTCFLTFYLLPLLRAGAAYIFFCFDWAALICRIHPSFQKWFFP